MRQRAKASTIMRFLSEAMTSSVGASRSSTRLSKNTTFCVSGVLKCRPGSVTTACGAPNCSTSASSVWFDEVEARQQRDQDDERRAVPTASMDGAAHCWPPPWLGSRACRCAAGGAAAAQHVGQLEVGHHALGRIVDDHLVHRRQDAAHRLQIHAPARDVRRVAIFARAPRGSAWPGRRLRRSPAGDRLRRPARCARRGRALRE